MNKFECGGCNKEINIKENSTSYKIEDVYFCSAKCLADFCVSWLDGFKSIDWDEELELLEKEESEE